MVGKMIHKFFERMNLYRKSLLGWIIWYFKNYKLYFYSKEFNPWTWVARKSIISSMYKYKFIGNDFFLNPVNFSSEYINILLCIAYMEPDDDPKTSFILDDPKSYK